MTDKNNEGHESNSKPNTIPASFDAKQIREILRLMEAQAINDPGMSKLEREEAEEKKAEHKFWSTQPVPKSADVIEKDGPLHPPLPADQIPQEPYELPSGMKWCLLDVERDEHVDELHNLLLENYVEDADSMFRFSYSAEFIRWALMPPGFSKDWHVGVRREDTDELIAFISGIPVDVMVRDKTIRMAEINFLCLHKSLRTQRLTPLMIKEVTRRVHLVGIFQAIYTVGKLLPKPVATCRYFHRTLNPRKLMDTGFTQKLEGPQLAKVMSLMRLPSATSTPGLRLMCKSDVGQVRKMLNRYLKTRTDVLPVFRTDEEIEHWFMPREGVIWTYVVEDLEHKGKLTDFFSYYSLPSSVLKAPSKSKGKTVKRPQGVPAKKQSTTVNAAYLFYYSVKTDHGIKLSDEEKAACGGQKKEKALVKEKENSLIKDRLTSLMSDALIVAGTQKFDVFNCLDMMDNSMFTTDLKFGPGDGYLRYYLFNYMARPVDSTKVGFVML
ncbi:glycylpeptide N-tetradecanoyltransferase [Coemansia sp. RSA 2607]|nr:glycylpeptide N-tetradecanoyltransferase [Coemansia sp. RSA 2607]KAJ2396852.1 glycylpeptide N-tetradecanoyltransferase [Coemansia sp. RSA 2603]